MKCARLPVLMNGRFPIVVFIRYWSHRLANNSAQSLVTLATRAIAIAAYVGKLRGIPSPLVWLSMARSWRPVRTVIVNWLLSIWHGILRAPLSPYWLTWHLSMIPLQYAPPCRLLKQAQPWQMRPMQPKDALTRKQGLA